MDKTIDVHDRLSRNSNIELLRIFATFGIYALHYNLDTIGGAISAATGNNRIILSFSEVLFISSVDLFILITGYYLSTRKKVSVWKAINLILQFLLFRQGYYLAHILFRKAQFSPKQFLINFVPDNYFIILYCSLYLLAPFINLILKNLLDEKLTFFVCLIFAMFSIWNTGVDISEVIRGQNWTEGLSTIGLYGDQSGYTIINFILMYCIGAWLRRRKNKAPKNKYTLLKIIISVTLLTVQILYEDQTYYWGCISLKYQNPLVILNAVWWFDFFNGFKEKNNKIINKLGEATFTMYLLHAYFLRHMQIKTVVTQNGGALLVAHIVLLGITIFAVSFVVWNIYKRIIEDRLLQLESKKRLEISTE